jgi:hypothetical protein
MKFNLLQKQTSRREILRGSVTLAGSALVANFFPATLLRASAAGYGQQTPSPADLLADMRARFNANPLETQTLGEDVTMLSGPGGKRGGPQRSRRQIRRGHFRRACMAEAQRGSRRPGQRASEMRH